MNDKNSENLHVLIVDDDVIDRGACIRQLKKDKGFKIFEAETGNNCLELCRKEASHKLTNIVKQHFLYILNFVLAPNLPSMFCYTRKFLSAKLH